MRRSIPLPRSQGATSRQAHADLPAGTYERELGRDGFYGPASHMYHRRPPTGWIDWEGPLRPRAFDLDRIGARTRQPLGGRRRCSTTRMSATATGARNARCATSRATRTATSCCSSIRGTARFSATTAIWRSAPATMS